MENLYAILGLSFDADEKMIRQAFCARIRELHPDTGVYEEGKFSKVMRAYEILSKKVLRQAYLEKWTRQKIREKLEKELKWIPRQRLIFPNRLESILNRIKVFDKKRYHEVSQEFTEDLIILLKKEEQSCPLKFFVQVPIRRHCPLCGGTARECALCEGRGVTGGSAPYEILLKGPVPLNEVVEILVEGKPEQGAYYLIKRLKLRFLPLKG